MEHLLCLLVLTVTVGPLQSVDYMTAREYVVANLKSLKKAGPHENSWIKSTSDKLVDLMASLPATDSAFKASIQKGINALIEIQTNENDTLALDLFILASSFADYYRSHKNTSDFAQNSALVAPFKTFEHGESDNPLSYFDPALSAILASYRHFYSLFSETIPPHITACQIEYLGSAFERSDADGPDCERVFVTTTNWTAAFVKLKSMPEAARNAALSSIGHALDSGDVDDVQAETIALQHLSEAKAFFGISP